MSQGNAEPDKFRELMGRKYLFERISRFTTASISPRHERWGRLLLAPRERRNFPLFQHG